MGVIRVFVLIFSNECQVEPTLDLNSSERLCVKPDNLLDKPTDQVISESPQSSHYTTDSPGIQQSNQDRQILP